MTKRCVFQGQEEMFSSIVRDDEEEGAEEAAAAAADDYAPNWDDEELSQAY